MSEIDWQAELEKARKSIENAWRTEAPEEIKRLRAVIQAEIEWLKEKDSGVTDDQFGVRAMILERALKGEK